jgi:Xaa-Pro aminopeptidase
MDQSVYARRREQVLDRLRGGVLVLPAAPVARRNGDVEHVYRQESDLLYRTGLREPESVLVLNPNHEKRFTLFVRPRDKDQETWTGRRTGVEGAVQAFGADQAFLVSDLDKELPALLAGAHTLYYPLGIEAERDAEIIRHVTKLRRRPGLKEVPEKIADLGGLLHELRLIKEPAEIEALRMACELTNRGHRRALAALRPGLFEYEVEAELLYEYRKGGGDGPGYEPIVASGVNATILHYRTGRDQLRDGDLLLIDSGCEYDGYTADVTRTYPIGGRFSEPQRALYELVLAAHSAAIAAIRPGATREGVHDLATQVLVDGLLKHGLLKGTVDSCMADKSYRKYYMHATSHWLGLDVHDAGSYVQGGAPRPLAPGFVLTVEPGIYIPVDDENVPAEFRGIGIRIEDDVLVTPSGCTVLTDNIPRTVDELARVQRGQA